MGEPKLLSNCQLWFKYIHGYLALNPVYLIFRRPAELRESLVVALSIRLSVHPLVLLSQISKDSLAFHGVPNSSLGLGSLGPLRAP